MEIIGGILLIFSTISILICCGIGATESNGVTIYFGIFAILILGVGVSILSDVLWQEKCVKNGVAEWVQVINDDGSVENEFKFINQNEK